MPSSPPANGKSAGTKTLTGVVSDSMWGAKHMAKDKSAAECARMCIKQVSRTLIPGVWLNRRAIVKGPFEYKGLEKSGSNSHEKQKTWQVRRSGMRAARFVMIQCFDDSMIQFFLPHEAAC